MNRKSMHVNFAMVKTTLILDFDEKKIYYVMV